ncbi:hypothetical protein SVAN01_09512 [Stagonosporopsis vannaccii]|nr:hypothetical protein SVAN01_09512 [Stagonosporopsis vannaccii]
MSPLNTAHTQSQQSLSLFIVSVGLIMYTFYLLCVPLLLLLTSARDVIPPHSNLSTCTGGTVYFAAHPADSLVYHNPYLFHDLYVYKCITVVISTSGDRGTGNNHSHNLEHGVKRHVQVSRHPYADNVRLVYLRLPDGGPVGDGYATNKDESLKKLSTGEIESISTTDRNATYTLDSLEALLATILLETGATEVRVLDYKTGVPDEHDEGEDHADHAVSARLVVDVLEREGSKEKLQGYAASFDRRFDTNPKATTLD